MAYPDFSQEWQNEYLESLFDMGAWEQAWNQASSLSEFGGYTDMFSELNQTGSGYPTEDIGGEYLTVLYPGHGHAESRENWETYNPSEHNFDFSNYMQNSWANEYGHYLPTLNTEHVNYLQDKAAFDTRKSTLSDLRKMKSSSGGMLSGRGMDLYDIILGKAKLKNIKGRRAVDDYIEDYNVDFLNTIGTLQDVDAFNINQGDNPYLENWDDSDAWKDLRDMMAQWNNPDYLGDDDWSYENFEGSSGLGSDTMCTDSCIECQDGLDSEGCYACVNECMQYIASIDN